MSRKEVSLKRNFALTLLGNLSYGGAQWAMLMVLAKLGSPEIVGRFALAMAVTAPVVMFAALNLRSIVATDAGKKHAFGEYLGLRLLALGAAFLFIAGTALAAGYDRGMLLTVLVIGAAKCAESVSDILFGILQQHEKMGLISYSLLLKGLLSLVAFALAMLFSRSLLVAALGLAAAWTLTLAFFDLPNARACLEEGESLRPLWTAPRLWAIVLLALPLGVAALLDSLLVNIPRYFVSALLGERELGIFAALSYVSIVGVRVVTALGESALPRLARYHQAGERERFTRLVGQMAGVGILLGGGGVLVAAVGGRLILTLLYRPEYAERGSLFVWLMAASALNYVGIFLGYALTAARRFTVQPVIAAAGSAVLALACLALIPGRGLTGVAMAVALCAAAQLAGNARVIWSIVSELKESRA